MHCEFCLCILISDLCGKSSQAYTLILQNALGLHSMCMQCELSAKKSTIPHIYGAGLDYTAWVCIVISVKESTITHIYTDYLGLHSVVNSVLAVHIPVHFKSWYFLHSACIDHELCSKSPQTSTYTEVPLMYTTYMRSELCWCVFIVSCTKGPYICDAHTKGRMGYELCDDEWRAGGEAGERNVTSHKLLLSVLHDHWR